MGPQINIIGSFFPSWMLCALIALIWDDVDLERKIVSISKSRYMSADSAPKTQNPFCNSIIEPLPDGGWRRTKRRYCCDRCKTDGYVLRRAKAMIAEVGIVEFNAILERF